MIDIFLFSSATIRLIPGCGGGGSRRPTERCVGDRAAWSEIDPRFTRPVDGLVGAETRECTFGADREQAGAVVDRRCGQGHEVRAPAGRFRMRGLRRSGVGHWREHEILAAADQQHRQRHRHEVGVAAQATEPGRDDDR